MVAFDEGQSSWRFPLGGLLEVLQIEVTALGGCRECEGDPLVVGRRVFGRRITDPGDREAGKGRFPVPDWGELVNGLARRLKVYEPGADLLIQERYICQAIIVRALTQMSPDKRNKYFSEKIDPRGAVDKGAPVGLGLKGPIGGLAGLGLAQAAGFSLYTSSASALAFVSSSVGVTLPFAAYTGLSSVLSVVTGPVGWLAMATWLAWQGTSTNWKTLTPGIVYIIHARAREAESESPPRLAQ